MRTAVGIALLGLLGCSSPPKWYPIPGATVVPWAQTEATCSAILEEGKAPPKSAKAQYRACMGRNGWTDSSGAAKADAERWADRRADNERLRAQIDAASTKNALTMLVGDAPRCQPGDPGTEICRWRWKRHLPTEDVPLQMTCVLPRNGKPRGKDTCRYGVDPPK
jgi:hypothetical protein